MRDGVIVGLMGGVLVMGGGLRRFVVESGGAGMLTERERVFLMLVGEVALDSLPICVMVSEDEVEVVACVAIEGLRCGSGIFESVLSLAAAT